ncbi:hypothetical protein [Bradyrhizobium lablabi]|uniref:hypothetical protein n=1 Tax=Bradyrhizobium lablabi TaxID=722472 RepID=UPI001BA6DA9A|nr:hypothetical protein [Bradyrhizobium lablabi]MBR0692733.1 hypothetical protein [Bradyrhizobium lablabi]
MRIGSDIFPIEARAPRRIDPRLLQVLAQSLATTRRVALRRAARAAALAELGDIELPDSAPTAEDAAHLEVIAPLYLACELEHAGLLRTAELVAGLFASGALTQPLGATAQLIMEFWKGRRERLATPEREQLFAQVFEPQAFYPMMQALCDALADQLDDPPRASDIHARVALQQAADVLAGWLSPRAVGMATFAANDIVQALSQATHFLRDRLLQTAFGVHDLWGLLNVVGSQQGTGSGDIRGRIDLGREGATVLAWLAAAVPQRYAFDPAAPEGQQLMAAAEAWRGAWRAVQGAGHGSSAPPDMRLSRSPAAPETVAGLAL